MANSFLQLNEQNSEMLLFGPSKSVKNLAHCPNMLSPESKILVMNEVSTHLTVMGRMSDSCDSLIVYLSPSLCLACLSLDLILMSESSSHLLLSAILPYNHPFVYQQCFPPEIT